MMAGLSISRTWMYQVTVIYNNSCAQFLLIGPHQQPIVYFGNERKERRQHPGLKDLYPQSDAELRHRSEQELSKFV